eukprot:UN27618
MPSVPIVSRKRSIDGAPRSPRQKKKRRLYNNLQFDWEHRQKSPSRKQGMTQKKRIKRDSRIFQNHSSPKSLMAKVSSCRFIDLLGRHLK